ncbi:ATP-dependent DNA helicase MER3 [Coemansia sp. RSA 2336]|nr:ATP-dependent DNA helicase MER3 [Coemansia sp. RSA 2336]
MILFRVELPSTMLDCSTSTLGVGVNLPAGAVIVKGTKGYFESGYEEHSSTDILQFIGRAGRPQFGASGKAIILTEQSQVCFYRNLVSGQEILESSLLSQLPQWIIAEYVEDKIFILIQASSNIDITYGLERKPPPTSKYSSGLANDINKALSTAYGPIMCIRDAYAQFQDSKGVRFATVLSREIASRCREDGSAIFQQIDGIGQRYAETLWTRGIRSISDLCATTTREIEHWLQKDMPAAVSKFKCP